MPDSTAPAPEAPVDSSMSVQEHLEELRVRLVRAVLALAGGFVVGWIFRRDILYVLKRPLLEVLPEEARHTILLKVIDKFFIDLKVAFIGGLFLATPFILYQIWRFVAPGLYPHEKRLAFPLVAIGVLFFFGGVSFCYFLILPFAFAFLVSYSQSGGDLLLLQNTLPDAVAAADRLTVALREHIGFTASILFAFGLAFETPLVMFFLGWTGVATPDWFARQRKFAIVAVFVFGAFLTPPDPWTQAALAIPLYLLYELGIWATRLFLLFRSRKDLQS